MDNDLASKQRPEQLVISERSVSDLEVLSGMLAASNDACWCMEFEEPVDLTAADHEVVRQIFENGPVWRHCNDAMERLYQLPADQDMNSQPVHEIFPNNPNNQVFVRNLIANGFEVDGAPALDRRYDGLEIYVENDVRAHISNGRLYRMFGTVRNVGKHRRRERALKDQLVVVEGMIAAIPNPFIAIDSLGTIETMNASAENRLGQAAGVLVGQSFEAAIQNSTIDALVPKLSKAMNKAKTLAIPVTARFTDVMPDVVWQFSPRETPFGTGLIVMIIPDTAFGEAR